MDSKMLLKKSGSILVVLLLSGTGVLVQEWKVNYVPKSICALQGASAVMPCTYTYPKKVKKVTRAVWCVAVNNRCEILPLYPRYWTYIGDAQNNCTLRITAVQTDHAAEYFFRFWTNVKGGTFSGRPGVTLSVTDLQAMVNLGTVTEGQRVRLTCYTTCILTGSPAFIWYRDGSPLSFTNQEPRFRASSEDSGNYSCAVKDHESLRSTSVILTVTYGPKNTSVSVSPSGEILEGTSVTLTCSSDANPPVQRYSWFKNKELVYSVTGGPEDSYTIKNITQQDAGDYYCQAVNEIGTNTSPPERLDVQYPPKSLLVSVSPSGETVEGGSVTLTCNSDANPPARNFTWFKNNRPVSETGESEDSYTIKNIRQQDAGEYYCQAENEIGMNTSPPELLDVQYPPKSTSVSVNASGETEKGISVTLTCSSDANPSVQNYTWFKNNRAVSSWRGSSHTISNVLCDDSGQYYCKAQNQHGAQDSTAVTIDVQCPLYVIAGATVAAFAALLSVIAWIAGRRRCSSGKDPKTNTEDSTCTVPTTDSGTTASEAAVEERASEKGEPQYSNVQQLHYQNQEEVLYYSVRKSLHQSEDDVQYACIQLPPSGAAPRSTVPTSEDVIYGTLAK